MENNMFNFKDANPIARNFFAINDYSKSDNGNYKVSGLLTILDNEVENFNGYVYHSGCYDNFCKNYYQANSKNIPLDIFHNTWTLENLAGKVTEFISTKNEVRIVAEVSKHAIHFNSICGLIEDGILQGFSDMSHVLNYDIDNKTNLLHVYECAISSVTLTPNPAVVKSQLEAMNATKFTFAEKKDIENKKAGGLSIFGL